MSGRRVTIFLMGSGLAGLLVLAVGRWGASGLGERIGRPMGGKIEKSDVEWRAALTEEQYRVARQKGTERAFTGAYWNSKDDGVYRCVCCGQPLFDARAKYDSGTGWPSFSAPVDDNVVSLHQDDSQFMSRTEVLCSRCDAHLGHVFPDGPRPTGQRYCMNSASLKLAGRDESAEKDPGEPGP